VHYTDNFIKPNYSAVLDNLGGKISGLSTDPASQAALDLRGQVNHAPLTIAGTLNPLAKDLRLDIKADVKGMELAPLSPYSGKYVGYGIEKGKLSFEVGYKVENGKLAASNRLVLDQLTFGERIESPTATKLPVMLAVSLLRDHNGVIDINLPIGGSLDDPQFSIGAILIKVIGNLIVKAVTAPFALLGSIVGGGDKDLSVIVFEPGADTLSPDAQTRLKDLAKALAQRPRLNLEIAGRVDPEADAEGLGRAEIQRKVLELKREAVARKDPGSDPSVVTVTTEDYPQWLERAYRREPFPKPRNIVGLTKDLPVEEMEKLMYAHAAIGHEALADLAKRRAQVVKDWLIRNEGAAEQRIFLLAPRLGPAPDHPAAGSDAKVPASRVEFAIKG
jgi:flagellar motor protein MotB